MRIFRKGVSPVIATVLLLILTVIIGGVVFSFVIPFVNDKLGESKACLDTLEGVEFPESKFNCYVSNSSTNRTGFSVKISKDKVSGVRIALIDSFGNSQVYDIIKDATASSPPGVLMAGGASAFAFPGVGGQKTYVVPTLYSSAEISPLTDDLDVCSVADKVTFEPCEIGLNL